LEIGFNYLQLIERGPSLILSQSEWDAAEVFARELSDLGIVGIRSTKGYTVIEPRQYVGRLRSRGGGIEIFAKNRVWFELLQKFLSARIGKRVPGILSGSGATSNTETSPASILSKRLEDAIRVGFPTLRISELVETSTPTGRLLFTESAKRFLTRGISHKVACKRVARMHDPDLSSIVMLAVELVKDSSSSSIERQHLELVAQLIEAGFDKVTISAAKEKLCSVRKEFIDWPEVTSLLEVCESILDFQQQLWDIDVKTSVGEYRFCDADRLWELAILEALKNAVRSPTFAEFHPYARAATLLFSSGGPKIDPDIVLFRDGVASVVVDAKNSNAMTASPGDVYQIVCYVQRLNARVGVLVYVSPEGDWVKELGMTGSGQSILAIGVAESDPVAGLVRAANRIADARLVP